MILAMLEIETQNLTRKFGLRNKFGFPWIVLMVTLFFLAMYVSSVVQFGKRFKRRRENIAAALS